MQGMGDIQSILAKLKNPYQGGQQPPQMPPQQRSFMPQNADMGQQGSYQRLAMMLANQLPTAPGAGDAQLQRLYQPAPVQQPPLGAFQNLGMGGIPPELLAKYNQKPSAKWGLL